MPTYEYGRIITLADRLTKAGIDQGIIAKIMAGGELIGKTANPKKKADWMLEAMNRMDALLDEPTRRAVRESCACCLTGKRQDLSKAIGKAGHSLEEAVKVCSQTPYVFGNGVSLRDDGRVLVEFEPEGKESYRCVCLPKAAEPVSKTYCYCCGGHIKHHLQNALNRKLTCECRSSALESGGRRPCSFLFSIVE